MPILEDDDMDDRALLWAAEGAGPDGQQTYAEPVEIWVNWKQKRRETLAGNGTRVATDVQVSTDRLIAEGSKLWLAPDHQSSASVQWYHHGSAGQTDEVMRCVSAGRVRDAKNIEVRYTASLTWYRDTGVDDS